MAKRGDIRDAFYDELSTVAGTYDVVDASGTAYDSVDLTVDDIRLRHPGDEESLPEIVYYENYTPVTYNDVGHGPDYVVRDSNGDVIEAHFRGYEEAQFNIFVRASDEPAKEPIYEVARTVFGAYDEGHLVASDFHADATDIQVGETGDADTGDTDSPIRGDQLTISIVYFRNYVLDTDNIKQINLDSEGQNYSIS